MPPHVLALVALTLATASPDPLASPARHAPPALVAPLTRALASPSSLTRVPASPTSFLATSSSFTRAPASPALVATPSSFTRAPASPTSFLATPSSLTRVPASPTSFLATSSSFTRAPASPSSFVATPSSLTLTPASPTAFLATSSSFTRAPASTPLATPAPLTRAPTRLALAPTRPAAEPPPPLLPPPPADPRAASARAAYAAGDYVAAARMYADLARDTAAPRYLFNAGMAREAAGELAHAVLLWRRYLASGAASAEDRELLARKLTAAAAALIPQRFQPAPELTAVTLTRGDHDPLELGPAELADPQILEAGEWTARIPGPGDPLELRFTVAADAPPVVLPAPLPRVDAPPPPLPTVTGSLTIHLGPPRALRGTVEISLKNDAGLRKETQKTAEATWELPRGTWTVSASAPDLTATSQTVTVGDLPRHLDLSLRLTPAARRSRIVVPAILGAAGLGLTVGGAVLVARSDHDLTCLDAATCKAAANSVLDVSTGLALVGTGVGALIPAATAATGARPRVLAVEAGLGSVLFAGGLTWYLSEAIGTTALDHRAREHTAATMLGLGAGLASSAVIQLLVRRAVRARRTAHTHVRTHHASR